MKHRLLVILIALDQMVFALLTLGGSKRAETISAAAWSMERDGKWQGKARPCIDWLASWAEADHCKTSWEGEQRYYK